ncbi:MAG: PAS domain S-box protein [Nitrospirae bacterium]|nr:MAG: PAS domain S-box protein [Nitrospirota bacterium]
MKDRQDHKLPILKDRREKDLQAVPCSAEDEINTIIRAAMDGFWIVDTGGKFLAVNEAYCSMVGYSREELLGMQIGDIEVNESPEEIALHMQKVIKTGSDRFETRHRCKDGRIIDAEVSTNYLQGPPDRLFVFLRDITERKKAEVHQKHLILELQAANRELAEFAHIVSHDLKAPLRAINSLASWLSDDYADKLDEQGREKIALLKNRVRGMYSLIEGILEYSKLGWEREEMKEVDLNELVPRIVEMLAPPVQVKIIIEERLPTVFCQPARMEQVFQNLLSNALQAMDKPAGVVRINFRPDNGHYLFSISDNGRGIETRHFDRIFQLFQTVSGSNEDGSSGIGLAVVKKNIELYGGKVWVESEAGKGSTFFFTLPRECRG